MTFFRLFEEAVRLQRTPTEQSRPVVRASPSSPLTGSYTSQAAAMTTA